MKTQLTIHVSSPNRNGIFVATFNGRELCRSETPLLSSARVLIGEGHDPDAAIAMRHVGSDHDALRAKLGVAAKLKIGFCGFVPCFALHESPPIAPNDPGVADLVAAP